MNAKEALTIVDTMNRVRSKDVFPKMHEKFNSVIKSLLSQSLVSYSTRKSSGYALTRSGRKILNCPGS